MVPRSVRQEELLRQKDRLETDFMSRELGIALTCSLFSLRLPLTIILSAYVFIILSEYVDVILYRAIRKRVTFAAYAGIFLNSFCAFLVFSMLGTLIWFTGDPLAQVAGVLSLVGALINVTTARSMHLPLGVVCGVPPAAALLIISASGWDQSPGFGTSAMALIATIGLLGYFGSALYQNYLVQSRLAQALDRARAASEAKSRFLADMNHEMRTPLNSILGLAQALRANDSQVAAAGIEAGARQLQLLVEDVLDLAGAEENALVSRPVTVRLASEATALRDALGAALPGLAIARPDIADDLPELARFDAALLRKTFLHAAARLVTAATAPPRQARLALSRSVSDTGRLCVTLSPGPAQTGIDTPADTVRTPSGRALSDELTDRLAAALSANITESAESVSVTLPVDWLPTLPEPRAVAARRRLSALVVDDVATNRFVISRLLKLLEIDPTEAEGGPSALAALGGRSFDLVLLDMNMPTMTGEQTFNAIRTSGRDWSRVPIIALTADTLAEQRDRYLSLGIDGFVPKPVDQRLLWAEISSALRLFA